MTQTAHKNEQRQLRYVCQFKYGETLSDESRIDGPVPVFGSNGQFASHVKANTLGPVIVVGRKGSYGKLRWSEGPVFAIDTTYYIDASCGDINLRWLYYALQTLQLDSNSQDTAVPGLNREDAYSRRVVVSSTKHQQIIASFLDQETAHIDDLIAAKERLIQVLTEKRHGIISQAVTQGLDPDVTLKPSGIHWLGMIPDTWNVMQLRRALASIDYGTSESTSSEGPISILRMGDLQSGELDFNNLAFLDTVPSELLLRKGDLIFNRTNSLDHIGKVAMYRGNYNGDLSFASYLVCLRSGEQCIPEYLNYLLNTKRVLAWARKEALPAIGQANLNPNRYGYMQIALPPREEQSRIVEVIKIQDQDLNDLIVVARSSLSALRERRASLITAAITGQVAVPQVNGDDYEN